MKFIGEKPVLPSRIFTRGVDVIAAGKLKLMSFFGGDVFAALADGTAIVKLLRPLESGTNCGGEEIVGQLAVMLRILNEINKP